MPVLNYHGSINNTSCDKGNRHFECIHWMGGYAMIDVEVGGGVRPKQLRRHWLPCQVFAQPHPFLAGCGYVEVHVEL